eukprot:CAMPEP_0206052350 /NCGR_PEP_ID=MMETSP1466-20131121/33569_1 /ASSEMBLY_ACC=CAM_ASM_001126 /TAXON_ID=44452 /ORGANISM="Pavlova gyrans, Strain CCMP608" /LENGTH=815 /DNA_ID=CAMNT_0053427503 /DNA_START=21 /DNA_END=2464 /DNA_ORIENTATION=+
MIAAWRGQAVRRDKPKRCVDAHQLIADVLVRRELRRGCAAFFIFMCYMLTVGAFILTVSGRGNAHNMERSLEHVFEDPRLTVKREQVRNVDDVWAYVESLTQSMFDAGAARTAKAEFEALFRESFCPFQHSDSALNPCANDACFSTLAGQATPRPEADACGSVISAFCTTHPTDAGCAQRIPAGGTCAFTVPAPTNPCTNPVCDAGAQDGAQVPNTTANTTTPAPDAGSPAAACAAIVTAHCSLFAATEPACAPSATEGARRLAEAAADAREHFRVLQAAEAARDALTGPRRLSTGKLPSVRDRVGMLGTSNRVIGGLGLWHSRYKLVDCGEYEGILGECVDESAQSSSEPFHGRMTKTKYTPGTLAIPDPSASGGMQAFPLSDPYADLPPEERPFGVSGEASIEDEPLSRLWFFPLDVGNFGTTDSSRLSIQTMRAEQWLDHSVKHVFVTVNAYNANLGRFASVVCAFTFSPGGLVERRLHIASAPLRSPELISTFASAMVVLLTLDTLIVLVRVVAQCFGYEKELRQRARQLSARLKKRMRRYVPSPPSPVRQATLSRSKSGSSAVSSDSGSELTLEDLRAGPSAGAARLRAAERSARHPWWLLVELAQVVSQWSYMYVLLSSGSQEERALAIFGPLSTVNLRGDSVDASAVDAVIQLTQVIIDSARLASTAGALGCVLGLLLLMRLFKYCLFHRRLSTISSIVSNAGSDLSYFGILFSLITLGFGVGGSVLFGGTNPRFKSLGESVNTLCLVLLGSFNQREYVDTIDVPELGTAFFWLYILICYLLLLNVLLAIIIDAYVLAKQGAGDEPPL